MSRKKRIILSCERGWTGIRKFSLFLARNGVDVFVLIKGFPQREVRHMITTFSKISNIFIPGRIYSLYVFFYLLFNLLFYRVYFFISTTKITKRSCANLFRLCPFFIFEGPNSYCIQDNEGREIEPEIILKKISI